jgi:hypothetical protein
VTAAPSASINYAGSPFCSSSANAAVSITGTTGGTFSTDAGLLLDAATGELNIASSAAGSYTVTYTVAASGGCAAFSTTATVVINAAPVVDLGADAQICMGDSVTLDAGNAGSGYLWNTGATTQTITVKQGGTYSVTVTGAGSCTGSDELTVSMKNTPTAYFTATASTSNNKEYQFSTATQPGPLNYSWTFGDGGVSDQSNPVHVYAADGTYTVHLDITDATSSCVSEHDTTFTILSTGVSNRGESFSFTASPNPFRDQTMLSFRLNAPSEVTLEVYDLSGKRISVLYDRQVLSGSQQISWASEELHAAAYMVRLSVNGSSSVIRILNTK